MNAETTDNTGEALNRSDRLGLAGGAEGRLSSRPDPAAGKPPLLPAGRAGLVFYDAFCPLCLNLLARVGAIFRRRGFEFVPLQEPWVADALAMTEAEIRREMKLRLADGLIVGGIDAWRELARAVWWLWPVGVLLGVPGVGRLARAAYRWLAGNRHCLSGICGLPARHELRKHHAATTFLELP